MSIALNILNNGLSKQASGKIENTKDDTEKGTVQGKELTAQSSLQKLIQLTQSGTKSVEKSASDVLNKADDSTEKGKVTTPHPDINTKSSFSRLLEITGNCCNNNCNKKNSL